MSLMNKLFFKGAKEGGSDQRSAKPLQLSMGYFNINDTLRDVANILMHDARNKQISIIYKLNKNVPAKMLGDRYKLANALTEIIGNAIDFTERRNDVTVEIYRNDKNDERYEIHFAVVDHGVGMEQSLVEQVLRPMLSGERTASSYGINGHGLQNARDIIHAMQGSILMQCKPDQGCRVMFYVNFETSVNVERRQYRLENPDAVGLRTLLIDDDRGSARAIKAYLEYFRHTVTLGRPEMLSEASRYELVLISSFFWNESLAKKCAAIKKRRPKFVMIENLMLHNTINETMLERTDWLLYKPCTQQGIFEMLNGLYAELQESSAAEPTPLVEAVTESSPPKTEPTADVPPKPVPKKSPEAQRPPHDPAALSAVVEAFLYGTSLDPSVLSVRSETSRCLKLSRELFVSSDGLERFDNRLEAFADQLQEIIWKYVKIDKIISGYIQKEEYVMAAQYCSKIKEDFNRVGLYKLYCLCVLTEASCDNERKHDIAELENAFPFVLAQSISMIDQFLDHAKYKLGK